MDDSAALSRRSASRLGPLACLLLSGGACFALGQGRWVIPIAAWLAPVLLIRFVRVTPVWVGLLGFVVIHTAAWEVAYMGMVKIPILARFALFAGLSLVLGLVFLADRWASRRSAAFWTTLGGAAAGGAATGGAGCVTAGGFGAGALGVAVSDVGAPSP